LTTVVAWRRGVQPAGECLDRLLATVLADETRLCRRVRPVVIDVAPDTPVILDDEVVVVIANSPGNLRGCVRFADEISLADDVHRHSDGGVSTPGPDAVFRGLESQRLGAVEAHHVPARRMAIATVEVQS